MGLFLWTPYSRFPLDDRVEDSITMADCLHKTSTSINVVVALIAFLSVGSEL